MSYQKPRILNDYRDLFWSLIPLVVIAVVFAGLASQCSFAANGPTPGQIPLFDVKAALTMDARSMPFPIRNPALPAGWSSNSGSRESIGGAGGGPVSTVGYLTPQGTYLRFSQTNATEEALARFVLGYRYASGTEQVGEQTWTVYAEQGSETAWIANLGLSRVLITGAGNHAAFTTLAHAVTTAQPLAR
ncbi:DUF4245 domain-containing protein [Nocardia sp. NPDC049190]|uniref:DUF4245 domain-containing protein n=1 Tax=Nocardia sp. NPDC049190 TaxID=3155650 RepID=UPI00340BB712